MRGTLLRTKPLDRLLQEAGDGPRSLRRTLGAWDLLAIGIGCIIGVGIFVLPGVEAAKHSGPGITLAFAIAAAACACSALSYAELAAMIPIAGSAYTYGYATLGEIFAWIIGWDLILEYMVAAILVSIGWSAYFVNMLAQAAVHLPQAWIAGPFADPPGIINLPAMAIVIALTLLLVRGIRESAGFNLAIVILKLAVIVLFLALASRHVEPANWRPFLPFGFSGVMTSAAIVFLAFVGFDAVTTAAEEAKNPQRDMPIGILGSLFIATAAYIAVSAVMTGVVPYTELGVADPVALVLNRLHMPWASAVISLGAIAGITSVLLVLLLGQPRILFAMSRDGLLPPALAVVHPRFRTPYRTTILTGIIVSIAAGLMRLDTAAELASIGTLLAFMIVSAGVIVLRLTRKDLHRPFKVPLFPFVPILGIVLCGYLMASLPWQTWVRLVVWLVIGLAFYAFYGHRSSLLAKE
jgi:APA family basic amino acid/polyamine antiporter